MIKIFSKIFGTRNDKIVKQYLKKVKFVNDLESNYEKMNDEELQSSFQELKKQVLNKEKTLDEVLNQSFAITRESAKRVLGMRHYDVQIVGGMVLNDDTIAEMKTGEGKTLVATLPVILNAMTGQSVHVVTVNDYLATRDAQTMQPLYNFLGFSVGSLVGSINDDETRKEQYNADITYGTNNEFGFDYLRDNMKYSLDEKVQRGHYFVIVDEVDSILIDEARTPLIISGATNHKNDNYKLSDDIAKKMERGERIEPKSPDEAVKTTGDFTIDEKNKIILITEEGIIKAEKLYGVDSMYSIENASLSHNIDNALKANYIFEKDVDYVVKDNEVIIVDEFTGRLSEGRRFSDGLHQALEAKENVQIQEESQTLADITFQNYFRLYDKLSGMTGTAQTEATEFAEIYNLDVVSIPTNVPILRKDSNDLIYKTEREKFESVCRRIQEITKTGQPILVGTASIEKSEYLHSLLKKAKVAHTVLNAKQHEKEGKIVEDAGEFGAVTIATNMAGRGVDIKIPQKSLDVGGLFILGTERHESRRIDNQLRGRAGRQGDVGESQFYLSLEDNLLRIFGSEKIAGVMSRLGLEEGEHIESGMVTRAVENAQKKVEAMHFESRKHLLEYDDVANKQRKAIFEFRDQLLDVDFNIKDKLDQNMDEYCANLLSDSNIIDGIASDDFNIDMVVGKLQEELGIEITKDQLSQTTYHDVADTLNNIIKEFYSTKMLVVPVEQRSEIERRLYLEILDTAWRDHLYAMDTLKTGIGLRSYNQKDPLVEYKKESYNMFIELITGIKSEIVKILFTIQFRDSSSQNEELEKMKRQMEDNNKDMKFNNKNSIPHISKKIARNEPCPCNSGKKYKQCCGKSGPKRGALVNNE
jgi:preprotein translocase subunit SecA